MHLGQSVQPRPDWLSRTAAPVGMIARRGDTPRERDPAHRQRRRPEQRRPLHWPAARQRGGARGLARRLAGLTRTYRMAAAARVMAGGSACARGRSAPSAAPALATITQPIAIHCGTEQRLAEQHDADQRGDRGLQAHPDAEDPRRDPAQRLELEPVRDHRGQQPDRQPAGRAPRACSSAGPALATAAGVTTTAATTIAMTRPDDAAEPPAGGRGQQDVAGPRRRPRPARRAPRRQAPSADASLAAAEPGHADARRAEQRDAGAASITHTRSIRRRDDATATASGPRNSIVTAMPSGILANAW